MKSIKDIEFGFTDAENYRRRENKNLFKKIFLKTGAIESIKDSNTFFIVGDKGTGKTAYAVYFSSETRERPETGEKYKSIHKYIRETDYQKFISLREDKQLGLSEYTDIWKVIIYLLLASAIYQSAGNAEFYIQYPKFRALKSAIDEYYNNAFSPEILVALQFIEHSEFAAEILAKHGPLSASLSASRNDETKTDKKTFQVNLLTIEKILKEALSSVKLKESHILFIDGIDIRPQTVPYSQYLDCVKGLANALWSVNNDVFPAIRDSKGRLRVIGLLRPDIFNSLGLQNRNTKLRDNSTVLNWKVVYYTHRTSELFKMADRLFSAQQEQDQPLGACWDHYFPFKASNARVDESELSSFVLLLRHSWHRPRDIFTILKIAKSLYNSDGKCEVFQYNDFVSAEFKRQNGEYLLGEVRDSLSFYYDEREFEHFLKFFEFLDGSRKFGYDKFLSAYTDYQSFLDSQKQHSSGLRKSPDDFLQMLYEQNILSYFEDDAEGQERFVHWCFLERTTANLSPKIKSGLDYEIHYGLSNALNIGKELKHSRRNVKTNLSGKILPKSNS